MARSRTATIIKLLVAIVVVALVGIQFVRAEIEERPADPARALERHLDVPPDVSATLKRACSDCHSNSTTWPWYASVAPVSWWVVDHVRHAREHMNLSEWDRYDAEEASHLLEDMCEMVESREMPLPSYTWVHRAAVLTDPEIRAICAWTERARQQLEAGGAGAR
jgi:hypothetical protein